LDTYLGLVQELDGWGLNGPVFFPLAGPVDPALLPEPAESSEPESPVLLVNVSPESPEFGTTTPVVWETFAPGVLVPHHLLAVAPVPGFPLRPNTTYAAVLTTDLVQQPEAVAQRLLDDPTWASTVTALDSLGVADKRIGVAGVFTTRDPLREMDLLVEAVRALPPDTLSQALTARESNAFYASYNAEARAPLWQHGDKPYATQGGGLQWQGDTPVQAGWDPLPLVISTPKDVGAPPEGGWPLVIFGHGTGGSRESFANGNNGLETAALLAKAGCIGLSFDQPLHGPRGTPSTNVELHSFNYLNPTSARAAFRQGALDLVWLVHLLREKAVVFTTPEGVEIPINPDNIMIGGHSHGGLTGALAAPWLGGETDALMLSGAGGLLSITIVVRKDQVDIAALLGQVMGLPPSEPITRLHPVTGLAQLVVEETDPINFGRYFAQEQRPGASAPVSVLLTSGQFDEQTDHETAEALAAASGMRQIIPAWNRPAGLTLRGLEPARSPYSGGTTGWDGSEVTLGLSQWEEGDHFVIYEDRDAAVMVQEFFRSAVTGTPTINTRPP
jgi:hypothetical protein